MPCSTLCSNSKSKTRRLLIDHFQTFLQSIADKQGKYFAPDTGANNHFHFLPLEYSIRRGAKNGSSKANYKRVTSIDPGYRKIGFQPQIRIVLDFFTAGAAAVALKES
jgi:hypothetical protein